MLKIAKSAYKSSVKSKSLSKSFHSAQALKSSDSFLGGSNSVYLEQMYELWSKDKNSVHPSWNAYFTNISNGLSGDQAFIMPPNVNVTPTHQQATQTQRIQSQYSPTSISTSTQKASPHSFRIYKLVQAYMRRGHERADIDPLGLNREEEQSGAISLAYEHHELDYQHYGFSPEDLTKEFEIDSEHSRDLLAKKPKWRLDELLDTLKKVYSGKIGFEYMHIGNSEERRWLRNQIENLPFIEATKEEKINILNRLCSNECFTNFLKNKFSTSKRFGIEGCDTLISGMHALIDRAVQHKVEKVVVGMPHRGRLNTLAECVGKKYEEILCEFQENQAIEQDGWGNTGDVKYHLGTTTEKRYPNGHTIRVAMLPNPSHLEAVDPLIQGKVRATQDHIRDTERVKVLGIAIHGDAAFAGQGVVYETMQMWKLQEYGIGGTIHIVANNQIGFTTIQRDARSGLYCTDIGKLIEAPIFHVNADDPESVEKVFKLATDYRMKFKKDVIIDLIGYRRYGHNELDQPAFTQPLMYKIINSMKPVFDIYAQKLISSGVVSDEQVKEMIKNKNHTLEEAFERSRNKKFEQEAWILKPAQDILEPTKHGKPRDTGVDLALLKKIGKQICHLPSDVNPHPQVKKVYEARHQSIESGEGLDWATGEALAFASLIHDGYSVRLSGEDVERGTFSHRHAVVFDQQHDRKYIPIKTLLNPEDQHKVVFSNSHLSEFGVLGFEYGYSIANPNTLVLWEGQFGDFSNEAQVIIDNFLVSGESKWGVQCGLTMLLPHGYDGQGPEHSSARLERYLELSDDNPFNILTNPEYKADKDRPFRDTNIQVCVPTTSSNYFHLLRRQLRRKFRKPLIIMSPKKLLRHKGSSSPLSEFQESFRFRRVIGESYPEELNAPDQIQKVVCCSGQVYFDLLDRRRKVGAKDIVLVRFEQLAPFAYDRVRELLNKYPKAQFSWCQEEHFNMGGWRFVEPRFNKILDEAKRPQITYYGRKPSASTAVGLYKYHYKELEQFLTDVFGRK